MLVMVRMVFELSVFLLLELLSWVVVVVPVVVSDVKVFVVLVVVVVSCSCSVVALLYQW